jgi:hypothetical protein
LSYYEVKKIKAKSVYPSVLDAFILVKKMRRMKKRKQLTNHTNDPRYCWVGASRQCLYP